VRDEEGSSPDVSRSAQLKTPRDNVDVAWRARIDRDQTVVGRDRCAVGEGWEKTYVRGNLRDVVIPPKGFDRCPRSSSPR
jgi:hypothetical protein